MPGHCLTRLNLPRVGSFGLLTDNDNEIVGAVIRESGVWELNETYLLLNLLQPGDQVIDVGAHIGYFTVIASKLVGETGRVIINGCHKARLERTGLLHATGQDWLGLSHDNTGDHRFGPTEGRAGYMVEVVQFDEWCPECGPLNFLKTNVQGCETPALAGMVNVVRESAARLIV